MKTTIRFIDKHENILMSIGCDDNPIDTYKIGDKIYLEGNSIIYPKTKDKLREEYNEDFVDFIIKENETKIKMINKRFKITSKYHSINKDINLGNYYSQVIEYKVKECEKIYLKWWYIKYFLKSFFKINKNINKNN